MDKKIRRVINVFCLLVLVVSTVYFFIKFGSLPQELPKHFNAAGEIDDYGNYASLIMLVVLNWMIWSFTSLIEVLPNIAKQADDKMDDPGIVSAVLLMSAFIKLFAVLGVSYIQYCVINVTSLGKWFMPAFLISMFVPMIIAGLYSVFKKK